MVLCLEGYQLFPLVCTCTCLTALYVVLKQILMTQTILAEPLLADIRLTSPKESEKCLRQGSDI